MPSDRRIVVLTGGHREVMTDLYFDGDQIVEIPGPRQPDGAAHGSGCTHSSALAARLAWGDDPLSAARAAKEMAAARGGAAGSASSVPAGSVDVPASTRSAAPIAVISAFGRTPTPAVSELGRTRSLSAAI